MQMRSAVVIALLSVMFSGMQVTYPVQGAGTAVYIRNQVNLPTYDQLQDYTASYTGVATDVGGGVTYDKLVGCCGGNLRVDPTAADEWFVQAPPTGLRNFLASDWDDIRMGTYHCGPASAAMMLQYWAADRGYDRIGRGANTVAQYIFLVSYQMDTNDVNPTIRNGDSKGHFAGFGDQVAPGIARYANSAYMGQPNPPTVNANLQNFDRASYIKEIDNNNPVLLVTNGGQRIGHMVVGFGYDLKGTPDPADDVAIYRDPWRGVAESTILFSSITSSANFAATAAKKAGFRTNSFGDIPITDSTTDSWSETIMATFNMTGGSTVGGRVVPVDRLGLLAPFIAFGLVGMITGAVFLYVSHLRRKGKLR